jgi:H+/Cl- antiporter ClcA
MAGLRNRIQQLIFSYPRPAGAVFTTIGAAFCYAAIIYPIQQAEIATSVRLSLKMVVVGIVTTIFGLAYMIFGARFAWLFYPSAKQSKMLGYLAGALLGVVGLGIYFLLKSYLESKGYVLENRSQTSV